jgi:hypothetical protein
MHANMFAALATQKAIKELESGKSLKTFKKSKKLFEELGI